MIYIDCGFWQGRALEIYKEKGLVDKNTKIYIFEPNPTLDVKSNISKIGLPLTFSNQAVWIDDKGVDFLVAGRPDAARIVSSEESIRVPSMDFPKFVSELPNEPIICNMDIEGAEFTILPKMIEDDSIKKISILEIEFHHRLVERFEKIDAEKLFDDLVRTGVKVIIKVPL